MRLSTLAIRSAAAGAAALLATTAWAEPSADGRFDSLAREHWEAFIQERPLFATDAGDPRYDDRLERVRPEDFQRRGALAARYLERLRAMDPATLGPERRTAYRALERDLTLQAEMGLSAGALLPRLYPINWHQTFVEYAHRVRLQTPEQHRTYVGRLEAFAVQLDDFRVLLEAGLRRGYTQPCGSLDHFSAELRAARSRTPEESGYFTPLRAPADLPAATAAELQAAAAGTIRERIHPALDRLIAFVDGPYRARCRTRVGLSEVPGGAAWYATLARHYTTTDTPVAEIEALGRAEVARLRGEMEAVMRETGFTGDLQAFAAMLREDPRFYATTEADYLARSAVVAKAADAVLLRYFHPEDLPRLPFAIEPIPAELAPGASATNFYPPNAGERKPGILYLNTYDLKARPLYELPGLTLHNAMPGHHLQIVLQQAMADLPPQVRYGDMVAYTEGWSLYAEWLGGEMGLYSDPYVRFGQLNMEMWRALRLVVDPGLHLHGWTREQAVTYMLENSAMSRRAIEHEVDRYISWPAQSLSYRLGDLKFRELRARAEARLGERFDIRDFHHAVLATGTVPLSALDAAVEDWLAAQEAP